jgi:hypothetical protein
MLNTTELHSDVTEVAPKAIELEKRTLPPIRIPRSRMISGGGDPQNGSKPPRNSAKS